MGELSSLAPRFEIKKWHAVALWSWDIAVDNCAICRNHIMDLCIDCQSTSSSISSSNTNEQNIFSQSQTLMSQEHPQHISSCVDQITSQPPNEECVVAWGQCSHAFHNHCISRWLKTRKVCPLDNKEWIYAPHANLQK